MGILRLPHGFLGKLLVVCFWWPLVLPLWLVWFVFIGWWSRLATEPYANIEVRVVNRRHRRSR